MVFSSAEYQTDRHCSPHLIPDSILLVFIYIYIVYCLSRISSRLGRATIVLFCPFLRLLLLLQTVEGEKTLLSLLFTLLLQPRLAGMDPSWKDRSSNSLITSLGGHHEPMTVCVYCRPSSIGICCTPPTHVKDQLH